LANVILLTKFWMSTAFGTMSWEFAIAVKLATSYVLSLSAADESEANGFVKAEPDLI